MKHENQQGTEHKAGKETKELKKFLAKAKADVDFYTITI